VVKKSKQIIIYSQHYIYKFTHRFENNYTPGDSMERLFIATQVGEIFYIGNGSLRTFLDICPHRPIPVTQLVQASFMRSKPTPEGFITLVGEGGR
jgi:hypothetical protein